MYIFEKDCNFKGWPNDEFEIRTWVELPVEERFRVVKDIIQSMEFVKKSRDQILEIFGMPDTEGRQYMEYIVRYFGKSRCGFNSIAILRFDFNADGEVGQLVVRFD